MIRIGLLLLAAPLALSAQGVRDSIISTSVTRAVRLVPDRAILHVSVEGTGETAKDAIARAETKVAAVREALSRAPAGVEVGPAVPFSVGSTQALRGYANGPTGPSFTARTAMRLQVTRIAAMPAAVAAALDAGGSQATMPTFEATAADSARRAAAAEAIAAARREAEAVAAGIGGRLGGLVEVVTTGGDRQWQQAPFFAFEGAYSGPSVPPEVSVSVTATVRFRLQR